MGESRTLPTVRAHSSRVPDHMLRSFGPYLDKWIVSQLQGEMTIVCMYPAQHMVNLQLISRYSRPD